MSQTAAKSLGSLQALSRYLLLVKTIKQLRLTILEAWTEESDFEVKNDVKEAEVCLPVFSRRLGPTLAFSPGKPTYTRCSGQGGKNSSC